MGFNAYAAGAKIYNAGSSAATQGTVDPTGYVERDMALANQNSGLAKAAKSRVSNANAHMTSPGGTNFQLPSNWTQITADPTGHIALNPYDTTDIWQNYNNDVAAATAHKNQLDAEYSNTVSGIMGQQRDTQYQQQDEGRHDLNNFSNRGMVYSSGYGQEVADDGQKYQRVYDGLDNQRQQAFQSRNAGKTQIDNSLIAEQQAGYNEATRRAIAYAGTLHLNPADEQRFIKAAQAAARKALGEAGTLPGTHPKPKPAPKPKPVAHKPPDIHRPVKPPVVKQKPVVKIDKDRQKWGDESDKGGISSGGSKKPKPTIHIDKDRQKNGDTSDKGGISSGGSKKPGAPVHRPVSHPQPKPKPPAKHWNKPTPRTPKGTKVPNPPVPNRKPLPVRHFEKPNPSAPKRTPLPTRTFKKPPAGKSDPHKVSPAIIEAARKKLEASRKHPVKPITGGRHPVARAKNHGAIKKVIHK